MKSRISGLIAAPFTAFNADGSLNLALIDQQAAALIASGVSGAFVCGTTGEGLSLSTEERRLVAEHWVRAASQRLHVIVHVGHQAIGESCALAAHAEKIGAAGFATLGPTFFSVPGTAQLVDYCGRVAAAAPGLPFFYYHIPIMTRIDLPMHEFLRMGSQKIPNLAGIKFTHENLMDYRRCVEFEDGRFNILFGRDEILLAALSLGATGAVGSTYNYMSRVYTALIEAFQAGDLEAALRFQSVAIRIIVLMSQRGGLPAGKAMMKMIGLDCGPVRPPLANLSATAIEDFARELDQAGFPALSKKPLGVYLAGC
jgi:N-acetylneuraminate lyase